MVQPPVSRCIISRPDRGGAHRFTNQPLLTQTSRFIQNERKNFAVRFAPLGRITCLDIISVVAPPHVFTEAPKGRRILAGGVSHRLGIEIATSPARGATHRLVKAFSWMCGHADHVKRRPFRASFFCWRPTGGLRHRLISNAPRGLR